MTELEFLREVKKSHEALLSTLAPSSSRWIQWVHRNAKGRYDFLKERYEDQGQGRKV
jgi:hypothetical protein